MGMVRFSDSIVAMSTAILSVLDSRSPRKVLGSVVALISIEVPNFSALGWRSKKCFSHKAVDINLPGFLVTESKVHLAIPTPMGFVCFYSRRCRYCVLTTLPCFTNPGANSPKVTHVVTAAKSINRAPFFSRQINEH
jgi:hypothetical protein